MRKWGRVLVFIGIVALIAGVASLAAAVVSCRLAERMVNLKINIDELDALLRAVEEGERIGNFTLTDILRARGINLPPIVYRAYLAGIHLRYVLPIAGALMLIAGIVLVRRAKKKETTTENEPLRP